MDLIAHGCPACQAITIFAADATFPRRCGRCDRIIRLTRPLVKCDESAVYDVVPLRARRRPKILSM